MISYEDEIRSQISSNIFKIALPLIMPVYLVLNIIDWIIVPPLAPEFLFVRLTIVPVVFLGCLALKKEWPGPWDSIGIWAVAFAGSLQLSYMAFRTGWFSSFVYLYSINLVGGLLLLLFPMPLKRNLVTVAAIYLPPVSVSLFRFPAETLQFPNFAMGVLTVGVVLIFTVTATQLVPLKTLST